MISSTKSYFYFGFLYSLKFVKLKLDLANEQFIRIYKISQYKNNKKFIDDSSKNFFV